VVEQFRVIGAARGSGVFMRAIPAALAAALLFAGIGHAEARTGDARQPRPGAQTAARTVPAATAPRQRGPQSATRQQTNIRQQTTRQATVRQAGGGSVRQAGTRRLAMRGGAGASGGGGGISCVPYARQATGMAISGNGRDWWHNAAGLYARGHRPEAGSVMAMPGTGAMRMGHVAVVERVIGPREIEIHHANWGGPGIRRGSVMRGVSVVDVSAGNDWSAVRIQVGHSDAAFGRVYPVYGFIHNRPDPTGGAMLAGTSPGRRAVTIADGGDSLTLSGFRGGRELAQATPVATTTPVRGSSRNTTSGSGWRSLVVLPANASYR
jgi:hypothetical protein